MKPPPALILPDPATRFARTAARLDTLTVGHPMAEWLGFMARLAWAQHRVAGMLPPFPGLDPIAVERAVDARVPPLAFPSVSVEAPVPQPTAVQLKSIS